MISDFNEESKEFVIYNSIKECRKCGVSKEENCFPLRNVNRDGIYSYCYACTAEMGHVRYHQNKEAIALSNKKYYEEVKSNPLFQERLKAYRKRRRNTDPIFRASQNMRGRVTSALRRAGVTKTNKFHDLLGCTPRQAVYHMTKGGHEIPSGMHVDHYIPCAFFDLQNPSHQSVCFNWRNLRLITAEENRKKHDSLPFDYKERLTEICDAIGVTLT